MSYQQQYSSYTAPPPAYDAEANQPLMGDEESDDIFKVANSSLDIRMQFVRKVYSILSVQILSTIILSSVYMYNASVKSWVQSSPWLLIVSGIGSIAVLLCLMWKARSTPLNYYLLALFTMLEGHMVGTIVTFYDQTIVLQALIITFGVFIGLTLFTVQSKWDFSGMAPFLFAGLSILLLAGIVQIFIPFSEGFQLALAIGGVVIFSCYIIFDTYLIFNRYSPEDYIMASVQLYMDFINLFIRLLQVLNAMQRD